MKLIKTTSIALVAGIIITGAGCAKNIDEFGNTNINPGIVAEPITAALFTNSLATMGDEIWSFTPGLYAQHYAQTQYTDESRYSKVRADFNAYYSTQLYDCQNIINYNSDAATAPKAAAYGSNANQIAIARILKAWWYGRVTDAWGDIPYSQALKFKGDIPYDGQQSIYTSLISELKAAVSQFDGGSMFSGDILLGADKTKWQKFANSLRLMLAVRLAKADPAKGKTEVLDALAGPGGVITTNSDNVMLAYPGGNFLNPFYNYYNITQRRDNSLSATLTTWMNGTGDRRVKSYGSLAASGDTVKGFPYGLTRSDAVVWFNANPDWARVISNSLRTATMPMPILTASQVWMARAEAAQLTWTSDVVGTCYTTGITLGWQQWCTSTDNPYDATALTAYLANTNVDLSTGSAMNKIFRQRWIASFPDGQEAWNVWREANSSTTSYLSLTPAPGTTTGIPHRFAIAQSQYDLNPANTQTVATQYTSSGEADSQFAKFWWDKQ